MPKTFCSIENLIHVKSGQNKSTLKDVAKSHRTQRLYYVVVCVRARALACGTGVALLRLGLHQTKGLIDFIFTLTHCVPLTIK